MSCMVDVARFFTQFSVDESCGKCAPPRGAQGPAGHAGEDHRRPGRASDLDRLERQAVHIAATSHCGPGRRRPIRS
ncbi:MAG: hypothetical protein IPI61_15155 [Syntrophaceae bacterium]|nr:hypothetical protein [Syntrophaceae bacterium]